MINLWKRHVERPNAERVLSASARLDEEDLLHSAIVGCGLRALRVARRLEVLPGYGTLSDVHVASRQHGKNDMFCLF